MVGLLLCCNFTILCSFKGDVSDGVICYLWSFFLAHYYIGGPSYVSLAASVVFSMGFISLCSLCCNMLSAGDSEVFDCGHEHTLFWPSIFF